MDINTNNYKIVFTNIANENLEEIYDYISKYLKEPIIANRIMNKIEQKIFNLKENPYIYVEVPTKPRKEIYRKMVVDNYIVLYKIDEELKQVNIHSIFYGRIDYLV